MKYLRNTEKGILTFIKWIFMIKNEKLCGTHVDTIEFTMQSVQ